MRLPLLLALCALVLAPAGTGQASKAQATFHAASASWESAEPVVGDPLGLILRRPLDAGHVPAESHWFNLTASSVHVEWDQSEVYGETPAGFVSPFPAVTRGAADYSNAVIVGQDSRDDRFAYLFPLDGSRLEVSMPCGTAMQSSDPAIQAQSKVDTARPPPRQDTASALRLQPCDDSLLTISGGPFLLVLWEWDSELVSDQGREVLWSGKDQGVLPVDSRPYAGRARQLYLTVDIGSLTLDSKPGWAPSVFMPEMAVREASQVTLTQARGTMAHVAGDVAAGRLRFLGDMHLHLSPDEGTLVAEVGGAREASLDGSPLPLATMARPVSATFGAWLALAILGFGAVLVPAAVAVRRRRYDAHLDRYIGQAYDLDSRLRHRQAFALTTRLLAHTTTNADIHFLHGRGLLHAGRPAEALAHFQQALALAKSLADRTFQADICIEAARAAAAQCGPEDVDDPRRVVVVEFLCQAIAYQPACQGGLRHHADLVPFLRELQVLLAGRTGSDWASP